MSSLRSSSPSVSFRPCRKPRHRDAEDRDSRPENGRRDRQPVHDDLGASYGSSADRRAAATAAPNAHRKLQPIRALRLTFQARRPPGVARTRDWHTPRRAPLAACAIETLAKPAFREYRLWDEPGAGRFRETCSPKGQDISGESLVGMKCTRIWNVRKHRFATRVPIRLRCSTSILSYSPPQDWLKIAQPPQFLPR